MAEHFLTRGEALLITVGEPDLAALERYFDVRLGGLQIVALDPSEVEPPAGALASRIAALGLDLSSTTSHQSALRSPIGRGIYMCMFPGAGMGRKATAPLIF